MYNYQIKHILFSLAALLVMATCTYMGVYDFLTPDGIMIGATTGIASVKDWMFFQDVASTFTEYGCAQSATYNRNREMLETTCKQSGDNEEVTPGKKSGTIEFQNFFAFDHTLGAEQMHDAIEAGTALTVRGGTDETGDFYLEFTVYLESFSIASDGTSGPVSYNVTARISGSITKGTNS